MLTFPNWPATGVRWLALAPLAFALALPVIEHYTSGYRSALFGAEVTP
jgi:hypothetical protein